MAFGIANAAGGVASAAYADDRALRVAAGILVGGAWFALGKLGGLPLVDTVRDWHPPVTPEIVTQLHRRGLLVMRRRRWIMWLSCLGVPIVAPLVIAAHSHVGQIGLTVMVLGVPMAAFTLRYYLSRCPRCGYGFFARSRSRAATLGVGTSCRHCGLSLYAYKG